MKKVTKAVVLAAGYGTRFMPFAKAVSKTMLPIIDTPTIQIILQEAFDSGIEEVLVVVGFNKSSIINHFSHNAELQERLKNNGEALALIIAPSNMKVSFVEQKVLDGTAGAVMLAKEFTKNEPFLLMYADDLMYCDKKPVSRQIIDEYERTGKCILAVQNVPKEWVTKYSSVEYSKKEGRSYTVTKIKEKPKMEEIKSTLSTLGRYILPPEVYSYAKNIKPTANGEKFITDAFDMMIPTVGVVAYEFEGVRYDIGNKFGYLCAVTDFALRDKNFGKDYFEFLKSKLKN